MNAPAIRKYAKPLPSRRGRLLSCWVSDSQIAFFDRIAAELGISRAQTVRLLLQMGMRGDYREYFNKNIGLFSKGDEA